MLPSPALFWACGMGFLGTLQGARRCLRLGTSYKCRGILHGGEFAFADQTHRLSVPEAEEAAVQRGHLRLQAPALPPEIRGADGPRSPHNRAGGHPVRTGPQDSGGLFPAGTCSRDGFSRIGATQTHASIKPSRRKHLSPMSCFWLDNDAQSHCGRRARWCNGRDRKRGGPPQLFPARP